MSEEERGDSGAGKGGVAASAEGPAARWLRSREPGVPAAFRPRLGPHLASLSGDADVSRALAEAGTEALRRALIPTDPVREGAFDLLAADALLTWACEAAVEASDPEARLQAVLRDVGRAG